MIKKISTIFLICCLLVSCGKKGDPEYKKLTKKNEIHNILVDKA